MWGGQGSRCNLILGLWVCVKELVKEGHPCDPEQVPKADRETQHGDCHRDLSYVLIPTKETKGWGVIHKLSRDLLQNISLKTCTIRPTALDMG